MKRFVHFKKSCDARPKLRDRRATEQSSKRYATSLPNAWRAKSTPRGIDASL